MKKLFYLFLSLLLLASCSPEDSQEESEIEIEIQEDITKPEQIKINGDIITINYKGTDLSVQDIGETYLFEGDILIPKDFDKSTNKSASITESYWWDNNVVPYAIDPNAPNHTRINSAIQHWEDNTNIDFVERTNESDYIYFTTGNGCASYVGQIGGRQSIMLSFACSTGNIIHEIGHAVGLWHEHSRMDRDDYVTIQWENISSAATHNFQTYNHFFGNGYDLTPELDFNSIMMYGAYSFSINGQPTIIKNDGTTYTVQRNALSEGDLYGINFMYPSELPNPDRDGDGIPNEEDECPDEAVQPVGEYNNNGCPWETGYHTFDDITVYRSAGKWYYYTRNYGWKQVKYSSYGYWYYV